MVREGIEAGAGTTDVVGAGGHPGVFAGDVDQLVLVEWGLSLFMLDFCFGCISLLKMLA